jgi:hypothetical protein
MAKYKLLSVSADAKTVKGERFAVLTGILFLAPSTLAGPDMCPHATAGCRAACLNMAGRGGIGGPDNAIQRARIRKTRWFMESRAGFLAALGAEIRKLAVEAAARGMRAAVRLNGTSDVPWEKVAPELFRRFKGYVQFYDYTKFPPCLRGDGFCGYSLTYSRKTDADALANLQAGRNVAIVFATPKGKPLPSSWHGFPVFDGDQSDLRFLDPVGHVVGVRAKGPAKRDRSGFVVQVG